MTALTIDTIQRSLYLNKVKPFIGKNIIKVFTGQRRVGKSYLLFQVRDIIVAKHPNAKCVYINKEDLFFDFIKTSTDLVKYVQSQKAKKGTTYLFIDEIQEIDNFEAALRSLLLDPKIDIYCTGSNAQLLSSDIAGQLSGRSIEIKVYSLTYLEFLEFHQLENNDDALNKFMKYGGLPYLKHLALTDEIVFEYLKNIYATIVMRDIINRYAIRNTVFLERLFIFLASNIGNLFSAKKISDFLKSQNIKMYTSQVQLYIKYFVNTYLIHAVQRYDIDGKRIFEIGEKYFFENIGIRNSVWGYRLNDLGKIMENIVYNHLVANQYTVHVGVLGVYEIDFIAEKNGEKKYIQVALNIKDESTIEREFGNLQKIKDNYPKMVITLDPFIGNTIDGIQTISLKSFLSINE